jgi:hypothetical protein
VDDGTGDDAAELLLVQLGLLGVGGVEEVLGVEALVPEEPEERAVDLVGAALADQVDLLALNPYSAE